MLPDEPDILIKRDGQTVMAIDTKWKLIGRNPEDKKRGVPQSDVYQMMAYARHTDAGRSSWSTPIMRALALRRWMLVTE